MINIHFGNELKDLNVTNFIYFFEKKKIGKLNYVFKCLYRKNVFQPEAVQVQEFQIDLQRPYILILHFNICLV